MFNFYQELDNGNIKLTRTFPPTGKVGVMELAVTGREIEDYFNKRSGMIQDAFPQLSPEERDFIMIGILPEDSD